MCACLCICMSQCRHAYVGQRSRLAVLLHNSPSYYFGKTYFILCLQLFYLHTCCAKCADLGPMKTTKEHWIFWNQSQGCLQNHHEGAWDQTWVLWVILTTKPSLQTFLPSVLRQGLSLNPELTSWLHWLARKS